MQSATDPRHRAPPEAGAPPRPLPGRRRDRFPDAAPAAVPRPWRIALVGAPNVGKSALFHLLTGRYATVSNYPGTSVEVTRGRSEVAGHAAEVLDTPGLYSLVPGSEEERVARRIVLDPDVDVLVHVIEARNLERSLPLTFQLAELGRPLVVALNMVDELDRLGLSVDADRLAERLGVEVVPIVAVRGTGRRQLEGAVARSFCPLPPAPAALDPEVDEAVDEVAAALAGDYPVRRRAVAGLLLQEAGEDPEAAGDRPGGEGPAGDGMAGRVSGAEPDGGERAMREAAAASGRLEGSAAYRIAVDRHRRAAETAEGILRGDDGTGRGWGRRLGRWLARPFPGIPVLLAVLYLGLYQFVGVFGAGTVVDWLEGVVFEAHVNPALEALFSGLTLDWLRSLWVGEYGLLTLGVRYAVAIILPIVGTFFLFFSVLEDSGYFPRLALLTDRTFKRLGLNGRAVIPMVLGFACDTMATMVTRTLETRRERVLATVLLALAIPCSAQLGVILAVLAGHPGALALWATVMVGSFLLIGAVAARVMPGRSGHFHMELPPLRVPRLRNVLSKTWLRMRWYFLEVLPLFLLASVLLWAADLTGVLRRVLDGLGPVVGALGLPAEAASVLLFGFFRRDYGAAGLYELERAGALDPVGLTVAAVTLTLFVPCIAQFLMMWKERGPRAAAGIFAFATIFAFGVGFGLNGLLRGIGL